MRYILVCLIALMAAAVGAVSFDWYRTQYGGNAYGAPFTLVDEDGAPISEAAFRGHPSAVFFGYTHCPEVCPTTLFELDGWLKKLGPEGKDVKAYLVTVDPERDTPQVLKTYIGNVSDRIVGISGNPDNVRTMLKSFGVYYRRVEGDDGDYTMDHMASILLLDSAGDLAGTIAYGENPDTALAKLKRLAGKGEGRPDANPDAANS